MKEILIIIGLVFLFSFVSGYQLGVGPPEIDLDSGECKEIYVFSDDYSGQIEVSDKWNREKSTNQNDYNLNSEDIGLDVRYFKNFQLNGIAKTKICIYGSGKYYGLVLFRAVEGNLEVGTKITFNGDGGIRLFGRNIISARAVDGNLEVFDGFGAREMVLMSSFAVSLTLLWFLFFILRQNKIRDSY